jgi:hypothetical protein
MKFRITKVWATTKQVWRVQTGRGRQYRIIGHYDTQAEAQAKADKLNASAAAVAQVLTETGAAA